MGDVMFWTLWSIEMFGSQKSNFWTMDSDHLPIMFCILDHIKVRGILNPVEKFTDWDRFQSFASALVSPGVEINSCIEADKTARNFATSIASSYRLSTKTTTT
jgi:hypothetical protein